MYICKKPNTFCGYIFNKSNKPIERAAVINRSRIIGTTTNDSGYFQLTNISENDTLNISFLGYISIRISAKELLKKPCFTIYLRESATELNEVLISNYLTGGITKKKDGSITVRAVKSVKGKSIFNVKGHHLLVKDTNARGFKGDKIQYRKIDLLTIKAIKQGSRMIYL